MAIVKCSRPVTAVVLIVLGVLVYVWLCRLFQDPYKRVLVPSGRRRPHQDDVINMSYSGPFLPGTAGCLLPDIDPHDVSVSWLEEDVALVICSPHAPLSFTRLEGGRQVLRLDSEAARLENTSLERLFCCYSVVERMSEDQNKLGRCHPFEQEVILDIQVDIIYVKCEPKDPQSKVLTYRNVHAVVQPKKKSHQARKGDQPNVLLLGIDAISRLNLRRTMPRTVAHLRSNNWIELQKYNKIADNTLPNLMAILSGFDVKQLDETKCFCNIDFTRDHCPFIWNDFKRNGYMTAYAEDEPSLSTFNLGHRGFDKPPTDYYLRPFMLEATRRLHIVTRTDLTVCLGPTSTTDCFLAYTKDLLRTYTKSLFALIWMNNFSHSNLNTPRVMDDRLVEFMQDIKASGALNNTFVLFFSDHGARFGPILKTYVGWLEERWPFMYIWVPEWFRAKYPDAYQNLVLNSDRLISPYDMHLLLKDLVDNSFISAGSASHGCPACPKCVSLFAPVSVERTCEDAGITPHWCTCALQTATDTNGTVVRAATHFAVESITRKLSTAKYSTNKTCAELKLFAITSARLSHKVEDHEDYYIIFETDPGRAMFDATVRYWPSNATSVFAIMGLISRINSYAGQNKCVDDNELKLYCFCEQL